MVATFRSSWLLLICCQNEVLCQKTSNCLSAPTLTLFSSCFPGTWTAKRFLPPPPWINIWASWWKIQQLRYSFIFVAKAVHWSPNLSHEKIPNRNTFQLLKNLAFPLLYSHRYSVFLKKTLFFWVAVVGVGCFDCSGPGWVTVVFKLPVRIIRINKVAAESGVKAESRHLEVLYYLSENIGGKTYAGDSG